MRYTPKAIFALQHAAEGYIAGLLKDACILAIHAKCVPVQTKDAHLARRLRGERKEGGSSLAYSLIFAL